MERKREKLREVMKDVYERAIKREESVITERFSGNLLNWQCANGERGKRDLRKTSAMDDMRGETGC